MQGHTPESSTKEGDFMSEAKDWAGELISGQTGTGRILVCLVFILRHKTAIPVPTNFQKTQMAEMVLFNCFAAYPVL